MRIGLFCVGLFLICCGRNDSPAGAESADSGPAELTTESGGFESDTVWGPTTDSGKADTAADEPGAEKESDNGGSDSGAITDSEGSAEDSEGSAEDSEGSAEDSATEIVPDTESNADDTDAPPLDTETEAGERTVEATLVGAHNAVSSYLMDASAWNYFWGETVPLGRKKSNIGDSVSYHTALRFENVWIPRGATILKAELFFTAHNSVDSSHNLWVNIYGNRVANCATFDPGNYDSNRPDQRLRTGARIDHWLLRCNDSCTELSEYDCDQRKLDCWERFEEIQVPKNLKDIVAEVVALDDWQAGNALCLFLFNAATDQDGEKYKDARTIIGYDEAESDRAPRLRITFEQ